VDAALADMAQRRLLARMWKKDYRVWKPTPTEIRPGDHFAVLAYLRPSAKIDAALKAFRSRMVTRYRMATTAGYGPRYLHSTGQLHKGGPSQGMFLELTEPPSRDLKIPGAPYTLYIWNLWNLGSSPSGGRRAVVTDARASRRSPGTWPADGSSNTSVTGKHNTTGQPKRETGSTETGTLSWPSCMTFV
jgi:hypothetical protein